MKSVVYFFIASFLLAFLPREGQAQLQQDSQYGFKMFVPQDWSKKSYQDGSDKVYDFYSPDEVAAIQLRIFKSMDGLTLDLLTQVYEQKMLPQGTQKQSLVDKVSKNGIPGKQGIYVTNYNGQTVGMSSFYTIQNGNAYVLTAIIPESKFEEKSDDVRRITQSFVIDGFEKKTTPPGLNGKKNANKFKIRNIQLCAEVSKSNQAIRPTNKFSPQTPVINAVISYTGITKADLYVSWVYDWDRTITRDAYNFTDRNGTGIVSLSKPNNGWPAGSYEVRFEMNGKVIRSIPFQVVKGKTNNNDGGDGDVTGDISGRYNFISRSDGKRLVHYHYIDIRSNGTYSEKYEPKNSPGYEGGNDGTWKLNGNTLTLTHKGGRISDTYKVKGNEIYRTSDSGITFKFRKNTR